MIRTQPTERPPATLHQRIALMRAVAHAAGMECDTRITAGIDAFNRLHLRTAYRHARAAWDAWGTCWAAEQKARELEAELSRREAS